MIQAGIIRKGYIELFSEYNEGPFARLLPGMLWPGEEQLPKGVYPLASDDLRVEPLALASAEEIARAGWGLLQLLHFKSLPVPQRVLLALQQWGPFEGHEELALAIGTRRETVTRALQTLREKGLVRTRYGLVEAA